jgi:hypothetical protein
MGLIKLHESVGDPTGAIKIKPGAPPPALPFTL